MKPRHVHVVGAGLAGLSAAVALVQAGCGVTVYEAAPFAGGRCRSYFDRVLGCLVDNGNHLLLSGNRAAMAYLDTIGARDSLTGPEMAEFPFMDLASGERWVVRPNSGSVPWWILSRARRVPGTSVWDYLGLVALRQNKGDGTVAEVVRDGALYRRLLEPLAIAALNTPPEQALARLLAAVVDETLASGGAACVPRFPRIGMSQSFIDPALDWLRAQGVEIKLNWRIGSVRATEGRVVGLHDHTVEPDEAVVLAVPPWIAAELLPGLVTPDAFQAIVNVHFRLERDLPAGFTGLIGGTAEWVFVKPGHASVTISAANRIVDDDAETIAAATWDDARRVLGLTGAMPAWRVVKEKRATFAATSAQERRRPGARTALANLALAGDWTATRLPATIEGAIRSGRTAAGVIAGG